MKGFEIKMSWVEKNRKINNRGGGTIIRDSRVTILRGFENNSVQLISNYVGNGLEDPARRWDQKKYKYVQIQRPKMVEIYNTNMGGAELWDMMLSTYRIGQKSSEYHMHIIYYCTGISATNSWLIHRRHMAQQNISKKQQYTLTQLQNLIANSLCLAG